MMKNLVRAALGIAVALIVAEGVFWARDGGAFPHVNVYVDDAELGVRLQPHDSQRIAFGGNPVTGFSINSHGYRAPEWADGPATLVVGDSQVFGLGVDDADTMPAALASVLGTPVLNGGVPTYGPDEYLAVVEEVTSTRKLDAAVLVINVANDLFEVDRPNHERHAVWDGWAVRSETAPASTWNFPGRHWLYSHSHAFFALRKWMHGSETSAPLGTPSEGGVEDLVGRAEIAGGARQERAAQIQEQRAQSNAAYERALDGLGGEEALIQLYEQVEPDEGLKLQAFTEKASVGDIVFERYAESSRRIEVTAEILRQGAEIRRTLRNKLRAAARERPDSWFADDVDDLLARSEAIDASVAGEDIDGGLDTPLDGVFDRFRALADAHDFEPVVVILPLDVQVSPSQFAKYDAEPVDMSVTEVLLDELSLAARSRGMRVAEPLDALRELGDAAFLERDLHLNAAGHRAVAGVLADSLRASAPEGLPAAGIPEGRSRIPWRQEWGAANENVVRHSTRNRCETKQIREWFRMVCTSTESRDLLGMRFVDVPLETHGYTLPWETTLVAPVLPGRDVLVDMIWADGTERFAMRWSGETVSMAFEPTENVQPDPGREENLFHTSANWLGPGAECKGDAPCLLGSRTNLPVCEPPRVNAGSAGHCFETCGKSECSEGVCTPWGMGRVCL